MDRIPLVLAHDFDVSFRSWLVVDHRRVDLDWRARTVSEYMAENEIGTWRLAIDGGRLVFGGCLREAVDALEMILLEVPAIPADRLLTQHFTMGGCRALDLDGLGETEEFVGHSLVSITRGGQTLQLSTPLRGGHPVEIHGVAADGEVRGLRALVRLPHFSGTEVDIPPLTVRVGDGLTLLDAYGVENREDKEFAEPKPGWNSWDYYRWTITEEEVLKNAEFIARDPVLSRHVKRIIIDDGWQYCYGEWEANHHFPSGMAALAKELTAMGFEPGLWFAPALMEPHAHLSQTGYDMLATSEGGQPCLAFECMKRVAFILDPTLDKTRKHLHDLFRRYRGMGYRYFKLDFLAALLKARRFRDASVPRNDLITMLLEPIHRAVAGSGAILGCNYPFAGGGRRVEAVRVGADIHARWENIQRNALSVAARFWGNRRLWLNDPDFAVCRCRETSDDPDLTRLRPLYPYITPEAAFDAQREMVLVDAGLPQVEILLGVVLMAGGMVNLSDNMPRLNARGLELARKVVAAEPGEAGVALDLFSGKCPGRFLQKTRGGHRALIINWDDAEQTLDLDLGGRGIAADAGVDFWSGKKVGIADNRLCFRLPPRSCRLIAIPAKPN